LYSRKCLTSQLYHCLCQCVVQCLFQLALWKKHFLWCWYCVKKQTEIWFNMVCTLIEKEYAPSLFSQTFFVLCLHVENLLKTKIWRIQRAHLHNALHVLSSASFICKTILTRSRHQNLLIQNGHTLLALNLLTYGFIKIWHNS